MSSPITLYPARKIITMDAHRPEATAVAVRDGRVLGVGTIEELRGWGDFTVDERFHDKVLMPGMVEGHAHVMEGGVWRHTYVGYYERRGPDGKLWPGLQSLDAVVDRLREVERTLPDPDTPLLAWGFDPIYFGAERMSREHLDRVSTTRKILVMHANFHLLNINTPFLREAGISAATPVEGIPLGADGEPTGELQEMAAMYLAFRVAGRDLFDAGNGTEAVENFARVAQLAGVTTITDLFSDLPEATVAAYRQATDREDFPIRLVPALNGAAGDPASGVDKLQRLVASNTERLHFGLVKLITDGSIQGFTARVLWPGYYNGAPQGLWVLAPQQTREIVEAFHWAGFQVHIHVNGDEASKVALDVVEAVLAEYPRPDHRHTLQHCQMADEAQFRRMQALGLCVNLFANHIYYWGDAHHAMTLGPDRANRMDATGTALRLGVPFAIHSDAPVTPLGPLFTAWCAVNRQTAGGRVLGLTERIPVAAALRAITLGAAYTLKLDHEIGSITVGKRADFAVLEEDPLAVDPMYLKDIPIWGTVLGGRIFPAPGN